MAEVPRNAPNLSHFNNRIVDIESLAKNHSEDATATLQKLLADLKVAPDGMGGVIVNAERFTNYLDRPGEV